MSTKEELISPASEQKWRDMARAMMARGSDQASAERAADASVRPSIDYAKQRLMNGQVR